MKKPIAILFSVLSIASYAELPPLIKEIKTKIWDIRNARNTHSLKDLYYLVHENREDLIKTLNLKREVIDQKADKLRKIADEFENRVGKNTFSDVYNALANSLTVKVKSLDKYPSYHSDDVYTFEVYSRGEMFKEGSEVFLLLDEVFELSKEVEKYQSLSALSQEEVDRLSWPMYKDFLDKHGDNLVSFYNIFVGLENSEEVETALKGLIFDLGAYFPELEDENCPVYNVLFPTYPFASKYDPIEYRDFYQKILHGETGRPIKFECSYGMSKKVKFNNKKNLLSVQNREYREAFFDSPMMFGIRTKTEDITDDEVLKVLIESL